MYSCLILIQGLPAAQYGFIQYGPWFSTVTGLVLFTNSTKQYGFPDLVQVSKISNKLLFILQHFIEGTSITIKMEQFHILLVSSSLAITEVMKQSPTVKTRSDGPTYNACCSMRGPMNNVVWRNCVKVLEDVDFRLKEKLKQIEWYLKLCMNCLMTINHICDL